LETVIYIDILFFINFIMDGLCLALTMVLLGRRFIRWRFWAACFMGGAYANAITAISPSLPFVMVICHLLFGYLLCVVAAKWQGVGAALANGICFFFFCAVLGGVLYAIYSLCGDYAMYNGAFYAEVSPIAVIAGGVVSASAILFCFTKNKARQKAHYCEVRIIYRSKLCTADCMCDSANLLTCPYTGLPVTIINENTASKLFTEDELKLLRTTPAISGVRPIPAKGIGGSVLLPSFIPDNAEIRPFGKKDFIEKKMCVAIQLNIASFAGCDGVIPFSLI